MKKHLPIILPIICYFISMFILPIILGFSNQLDSSENCGLPFCGALMDANQIYNFAVTFIVTEFILAFFTSYLYGIKSSIILYLLMLFSFVIKLIVMVGLIMVSLGLYDWFGISDSRIIGQIGEYMYSIRSSIYINPFMNILFTFSLTTVFGTLIGLALKKLMNKNKKPIL